MTKPLSRADLAELCECRQEELPRAPTFSITAYTPPGPVGAAYIRSMGPIDAVMGPAGSGKTVASIFKVVRFSIAAMPVCRDGIIRVRGTVLRDNFRAMYRTTIRSWFEFFPPDYHGAVFTGGQDRPAQHILKLSTVRVIGGIAREVPVELTVDFFAVGDIAIEELLKGYETSWVWCNEGDLLARRVIPFAYSRTGRYPARARLEKGVRLPRVVAVDYNPPAPKHPLYVACKSGTFQSLEANDNVPREKAINFFQQPSGLAPDAENRAGKSFEAYAEEARTGDDEDVRRFVHGLPGYPSDGAPIYRKEFNRKKHVAGGALPIDPRLPLHAGFDQGHSPGVVFFQESSLGQIRMLREFQPGKGVGIERFVEGVLPLLHGAFRGCPPGVWTGDPAGFYGADKLRDEMHWMQMVSAALGHQIEPAATNAILLRWDAVRYCLKHDLDAATPSILIDPSCELLIEGFEAEYKHPKKPDGTFDENGIVKNLASNVHEAAQYGILGLRGPMEIMKKISQGGRAGNIRSIGGFVQGNGDFRVF